ncbi:hypothetical protein [Parapedobacter koreensis]|uniref:Lipoprotein n=1 Tax=Parapedobacter koreensis TaxID=332977 RepID=A0A1H7T8G2_9SPHI|nr:hypothetical protein [Parapedobacter koreensis]SEL81181.1 hypothetical protein SAMN05421740_110155 [Parapedobacter koreensis]
MKTRNLLAVCAGILLLATQCQQPNNHQQNTEASDTTLVAELRMDGEYRLDGPLVLHFAVYNPTIDTLRFTQYHTPFEGFLNNFLTITNSEGQEMPYIGPMAKRVMPPVAESYRKVPPMGRDTVSIDIRKGYRIETSGTYTIRYNGGNVSGMADGEAIQVVVTE